MALSGTIKNAYRGWTYRMYWSGKQSIENNQTTITIDHYIDCGSGYDLYIGSRENSCTVGSDTKSFTSPKISTSGGTSVKLGTTTHVVTHNDDGSKNVTISGTFNIKATLSGTYKANLSASATVALDTIARASQPSCVTWPEHTQNVGEFGDTISIHMNRKSDSFTHTVRYAYGSLTGTIAKNVETGTTWTIPLSFMNHIPEDTSGSGTIYVDTYNGTKLIGTKYCGFTAKVPASVKPTCSIQVLDATDTKDTYGSLVKSLSKLYVKTTGTPAYSSPIASYNVTANGSRYTEAEITTGFLIAAGTTTVTATVTDKRGRPSAAASASFPVLDYTKPTISALSVHRCDADGTENDQGEYILVTFSAAVTPLNNKNSAAYTLRYKKSTEDSYTSKALSALAGKYTVTDYEYIFAADSDFSYDIEVDAKDDIHTFTRATSASTGFTFMDWNDDGKSIAFGKVSEESGALENALNLKQIGNRYVFSTPGVASRAGYICMAQMTHIAANADTPLTFVFSRRLEATPMTVHVQFRTDSTTVDPQLKNITYEGSNYGAFLVKTATSVWELYVQKVSAYDTITLQDWYTTATVSSRLKLTFPGTLVDEVPDGLLGFYRATPAKMQSILDYIYPVGSIYLSYSHVSPADLFGGTWERIENAFLWAVASDGIIGQTGGEKTHKLTVNELPSHTHGNVYSGSTPADKLYPWMAGSGTGDKLGYGTVATGGGAAHNNMPPYIQVSAWRRTA